MLKGVASKALKFMIEGMAVALAAYYIPKRKMQMGEIIAVAISAAAVFAVIDILAPQMSSSLRTGMGLGVGLML